MTAAAKKPRKRLFPDSIITGLGMLLFSGYPHVALLHAAGTKAGLTVNGRTETPFGGYDRALEGRKQ